MCVMTAQVGDVVSQPRAARVTMAMQPNEAVHEHHRAENGLPDEEEVGTDDNNNDNN